ncbi:hypothetical protein BD410DRAFT_793422 [Rickenella mellea]|uniref:Uncharacterized protein n=1 Tax=Rickenella mellea TaxID=50990 RepID=A0A4Y7PTI7_9AGAM|nr:hypothetical protein BD410DRAFT_793422 [Rickenella mellea]
MPYLVVCSPRLLVGSQAGQTNRGVNNWRKARELMSGTFPTIMYFQQQYDHTLAFSQYLWNNSMAHEEVSGTPTASSNVPNFQLPFDAPQIHRTRYAFLATHPASESTDLFSGLQLSTVPVVTEPSLSSREPTRNGTESRRNQFHDDNFLFDG